MSGDPQVSDAELLGYADELLPISRASEIEGWLREDAGLRKRAARLLKDRDDGVHSFADIWRRHRVSCPSRTVLGGLLLGTLTEEIRRSIDIHVNECGCRYCRAEIEDLVNARSDRATEARRRKFFESSLGIRSQPK